VGASTQSVERKRRPGRPPQPRPPAKSHPWENPSTIARLDEILQAIKVDIRHPEVRKILLKILHRARYFGGDARGG
jgi:hypothetical protein